jgi:Flp pilus assembly protein TadD
LYIKERRFQTAIDLLKEALKSDPDNPKIHFALGTAYDKAGQVERTILEMEQVLQLDPDNADALNYLGYTFAVQGIRLDEAEQLIQRALKLRPDDGYITDSLGWVYYKQNDIDGAIEQLEKAVELVPEDPIILEHLGDALLRKGQRQRALKLFEKAFDLESEERTQNQKEDLGEKIRKLREENL